MKPETMTKAQLVAMVRKLSLNVKSRKPAKQKDSAPDRSPFMDRAVPDFIDGYFATNQRSDKTKMAYGCDLNHFIDYIGGRRRVASVKAAEIEAWAQGLREAGCKPATIRRKLATLKVFFGYWVRRDVIEFSPTVKVKISFDSQKYLPEPLSRREVEMLLSRARKEAREAGDERRGSRGVSRKFLALRNLMIVEMLLLTGVRVGELCGIVLDDVDLDEGTIRVYGKGRVVRKCVIPETGTAVAVLRHYLDCLRQEVAYPVFLVVNNLGNAMRYPNQASIIVADLAARAGIRRRVTAHGLRHTAATMMIEGGADIRVVQRFLGHASLAMTQHYARVNDQFLRREVVRCHGSAQQATSASSTWKAPEATAPKAVPESSAIDAETEWEPPGGW